MGDPISDTLANYPASSRIGAFCAAIEAKQSFISVLTAASLAVRETPLETQAVYQRVFCSIQGNSSSKSNQQAENMMALIMVLSPIAREKTSLYPLKEEVAQSYLDLISVANKQYETNNIHACVALVKEFDRDYKIGFPRSVFMDRAIDFLVGQDLVQRPGSSKMVQELMNCCDDGSPSYSKLAKILSVSAPVSPVARASFVEVHPRKPML